MREIERLADTNGLPYAQLMQNAGKAAADAIRTRIRPSARPLVLIGPGNNGGDGLVCAQALAEAGHNEAVRVWLLRPRDPSDPVFAAAAAAPIDMALGDLHVLNTWLADTEVIVDALLGTGVARPIDGPLGDVLKAVQARRATDGHWTDGRRNGDGRPSSAVTLIALDGPTGMNYDTGALDPATVPADVTITFHAPKRGHYCYPAAGALGELIVVPIGIDRAKISALRPKPASTTGSAENGPKADSAPSAQTHASVELVDETWMRSHLPTRKTDSNKGSYGKVLVAGGCADYMGAPTLSARAAYRTGAGLVAYAVPQVIQHAAALLCPEATFVPLPESQDAHTVQSLGRIQQWLKTATDGAAVALGPGMGQADSSRDFLIAFGQAARAGKFPLRGLVCDADALNMLAKVPDWHTQLPPLTVLTPHPGEMSRLAQLRISEVQADRIGYALHFAQVWGHIVLLKGAYTVIASPDGHGAVLPFANAAMATAGTGDVLTGCIAGLVSQGLSPFDAAVCGGYLHGASGERWRDAHGDSGLLAGDLLALLPDVMRDLRRMP